MAKKRPNKGAKKRAPKPAAKPRSAPSGPPKIRRDERLALERQARRRQQLIRRAAILGALAVLAATLGFIAFRRAGESDAVAASLTSGSCSLDRRSDPTDAPPNNHTPPPSYEVNPPAGGNHSAGAAAARIYKDVGKPVDGEIVHAMEHGYVVLWHRPAVAGAELETLTGVAERHERDVLMVPRASLPSGVEVAATAWGRRLLCGEVEADNLRTFIDRYKNQGPERVPH